MYVRMTTFRGPPEQMEEGVRLYRDQVIPWLKDATGFRGWVVLIERESQKAVGLTFWATEQAARDAESSGGVLRDEVAAGVGATMESLELYEVQAVESLQLDDRR